MPKYGKDRTIHRTGTIDIQVDPRGRVVRVWFRCLNLPFTVSQVEDSDEYNPADTIAIDEISYEEL